VKKLLLVFLCIFVVASVNAGTFWVDTMETSNATAYNWTRYNYISGGSNYSGNTSSQSLYFNKTGFPVANTPGIQKGNGTSIANYNLTGHVKIVRNAAGFTGYSGWGPVDDTGNFLGAGRGAGFFISSETATNIRVTYGGASFDAGAFVNNTWMSWRVQVVGNAITFYLNETQVGSGTLTNSGSAKSNNTYIGNTSSATGWEVYFDNIQLCTGSCDALPAASTSIIWSQNITNQTVNHNGTPYIVLYDFNATNTSPQIIVLNYSVNTTHFAINNTTGVFSKTGSNISATGVYWVTVTARANDSSNITQEFSVNITNTIPSNNWSNNPQTFNHNASRTWGSYCTDPDGDALTYTKNLTFFGLNSSGVMNFTGSNISATGVYSVNVTCNDTNLANTTAVTITVQNTAPAVSCTNQSHRYYTSYSVCDISDQDGDSVVVLENGTHFTNSTSQISFAANAAAVGNYLLRVNATDGAATTETYTSQNITNISATAIALCTGINTVKFVPNISLVNFTTGRTTQSVLMNGTAACSFIVNATGEEANLLLYVKVNATNNSYKVTWNATNLTTSYVLLGNFSPNTTGQYNVTGHWTNASYNRFPIKISVNVTV
jgi:hypothetical protein